MVTRRKQLLLQRVCRQHVASCMSGDLRFVSSSAASAAVQEAGMVFIRRSRQTVVSHAGRIDVFGFFFFLKTHKQKGEKLQKKTFVKKMFLALSSLSSLPLKVAHTPSSSKRWLTECLTPARVARMSHDEA